jgi:hypothetical protein
MITAAVSALDVPSFDERTGMVDYVTCRVDGFV